MTAFNDNNITDAGRCDINLYTPKPVPFQQTPFTPRANFPTRTPTPIEKSNRPIVYHVVRLPMSFKQGELKVSRYMYVEWSTRFVFK
jgi:hypothetical protein